MYDSRDIFQFNEGSMRWSAYRLLSVRSVLKKLKSDMSFPQVSLVDKCVVSAPVLYIAAPFPRLQRTLAYNQDT